MSQPFRIPSLDGGGIMGAFAASSLASWCGRRIGGSSQHDDLMSRRNAVAAPEPIDFCHDHFGFSWIRTCTLAEAHSRPGLATAEASRLGGRSALTASSSCSRGSSAFAVGSGDRLIEPGKRQLAEARRLDRRQHLERIHTAGIALWQAGLHGNDAAASSTP